MAASTPTKPAKSEGPNLLVPPDEQFWKRYSPHGEAPMSMAGSFALHALLGGALVLLAVYAASAFTQAKTSLPVDPVRLELGGGGGNKSGSGPGKGIGDLKDATGGEVDKDLSQAGIEQGERRPALNPVERTQIEQKFNPADARYISESPTDTAKAFARLEDSVRSKLASGIRAGAGKGGTGEGGGSGTGKGKGDGAGTGDGKASLSKREKRMLRWHMQFTANTGPEYLSQLRGLGAVLAFPVTEGPDPQYKVVENLVRGGKLLDKDVSEYHRIYWIDDKPTSVRDIISALGLTLPRVPSRFVAFMSESLEKQLFDMERAYVERVLKREFNEELIDETHFRVVKTGRGYRPELIRVTVR